MLKTPGGPDTILRAWWAPATLKIVFIHKSFALGDTFWRSRNVAQVSAARCYGQKEMDAFSHAGGVQRNEIKSGLLLTYRRPFLLFIKCSQFSLLSLILHKTRPQHIHLNSDTSGSTSVCSENDQLGYMNTNTVFTEMKLGSGGMVSWTVETWPYTVHKDGLSLTRRHP